MNKNKKNDLHDQDEDSGFDLKGYVATTLLGSGSFGKVFRARKKHGDSNEVAIKMFNKANVSSGEIERIKTEAKILSHLDHPNIVKFYDIVETGKKLYIIMELVRDGSLEKLIKEKKANNGFTDQDASVVMKKILEAVVYLHDNNIIHRDLKPENILIDDKTNMNSVKIADFGLSAHLNKSTYSKLLSEKCGTLLYMAPEFANEQEYSKPVDIWSCGIIMYEIVSMGKHPIFDGKEPKEIFYQKLKNPIWEFTEQFTNLSKDFFQKLSCQSASKRYSANQALSHPWITRNLKDNIPLTFEETNILYFKSLNLIKVIKGLMAIKFIKDKALEEMKKEYESRGDRSRVYSGKRTLVSGKKVKQRSNMELSKQSTKEVEANTSLELKVEPKESLIREEIIEKSLETNKFAQANIFKSNSIIHSKEDLKGRLKLNSIKSGDENLTPSRPSGLKPSASTSPLRKQMNFSPPVRRTELLLQSNGTEASNLIRPMRISDLNQEALSSPRTRNLLSKHNNKMLSTTQTNMHRASSPKNISNTSYGNMPSNKANGMYALSTMQTPRGNESSIMADPNEDEEEIDLRMLASEPLKRGSPRESPRNRKNLRRGVETIENSCEIDARMLESEPIKRSFIGGRDSSLKKTKGFLPNNNEYKQINSKLGSFTKITNCDSSIYDPFEQEGESKMLGSDFIKKNQTTTMEFQSKRGTRIDISESPANKTPVSRKKKNDPVIKEEIILPTLVPNTDNQRAKNKRLINDNDIDNKMSSSGNQFLVAPYQNDNQQSRSRARSSTFTEERGRITTSITITNKDKVIESEREIPVKDPTTGEPDEEQRKISGQEFRIHLLPRNYAKNETFLNEKEKELIDRGKSPLKLTAEMATSLKLHSAQRARSGNPRAKN